MCVCDQPADSHPQLRPATSSQRASHRSPPAPLRGGRRGRGARAKRRQPAAGSPKGGAAATSTDHRHPATARLTFRHRKTPRERRRFGRRRSRSPQGEPIKRGGRIKPSSPSNRRGRPFANGFPTTMRSHAPTCSTSAPTLASRSRSPAKTVPSSSSIPTEATERTAPEKPLPNRYLAQRSGSPCS